MYMDGWIMEQQKQRIVVCIRKTDNPTTPCDYRPIILLKTDYKILRRIAANRTSHKLPTALHSNQ